MRRPVGTTSAPRRNPARRPCGLRTFRRGSVWAHRHRLLLYGQRFPEPHRLRVVAPLKSRFGVLEGGKQIRVSAFQLRASVPTHDTASSLKSLSSIPELARLTRRLRNRSARSDRTASPNRRELAVRRWSDGDTASVANNRTDDLIVLVPAITSGDEPVVTSPSLTPISNVFLARAAERYGSSVARTNHIAGHRLLRVICQMCLVVVAAVALGSPGPATATPATTAEVISPAKRRVSMAMPSRPQITPRRRHQSRNSGWFEDGKSRLDRTALSTSGAVR